MFIDVSALYIKDINYFYLLQLSPVCLPVPRIVKLGLYKDWYEFLKM